MKAYELVARIHHGSCLEATLPELLPDGEAKIIVLLPDRREDGDEVQRQYLKSFFKRLENTERPRLSKEEIDRYLEEERASWED